jgi:hypothetical protein
MRFGIFYSTIENKMTKQKYKNGLIYYEYIIDLNCIFVSITFILGFKYREIARRNVTSHLMEPWF